jgi:hypothetical protein
MNQMKINSKLLTKVKKSDSTRQSDLKIKKGDEGANNTDIVANTSVRQTGRGAIGRFIDSSGNGDYSFIKASINTNIKALNGGLSNDHDKTDAAKGMVCDGFSKIEVETNSNNNGFDSIAQMTSRERETKNVEEKGQDLQSTGFVQEIIKPIQRMKTSLIRYLNVVVI